MVDISKIKPIEAIILREESGKEITLIKGETMVKIVTNEDFFQGKITFIDEQSIRVENSPFYFWEQLTGLEIVK